MDTPTIGQIYLFAGNFNPMSFYECDGRMLKIQAYQALFAIIGITFGGDGRENFCIPKIDKEISQGQLQGEVQYVICHDGTFPNRS